MIRTHMATLCSTAAALFLAVTVIARVPAADVQEIVRKTKSLYDATGSAVVTFQQSGKQGSMRGTLQYARGEKFRLELPQQTIVSNGTLTWSYAPSKNQVVVSKAAANKGGLTPGQILTSFPGNYTTQLVGEKKLNGKSVWVVKCTAGAVKVGDVSQATLYIDKGSYRFQQIDLVSPSMGDLTFKITSAKYNVVIPQARFSFTAPKGARVIDLSK